MTESIKNEPLLFESLDLRVPDEAFVWHSNYCTRILVRLPDMDGRFKAKVAERVNAGLIGRGMAGIDGDDLLRIVFCLTEAERESNTLLSQYTEELLNQLSLPDSAVEYASIDEVILEPEFEAKVDQAIRALGLRTLKIDE